MRTIFTIIAIRQQRGRGGEEVEREEEEERYFQPV
jgi:hypothetical protein